MYLLNREVTDLDTGIYYFHPASRDLRPIDLLNSADLDKRLQATIIQPELATAPALLLLTADLRRTLWKYSTRHYRTVHIDAGVLLQTLLLVATDLSLAARAFVGFYDRAAAELCRLDEPSEFAVVGVALGRTT